MPRLDWNGLERLPRWWDGNPFRKPCEPARDHLFEQREDGIYISYRGRVVCWISWETAQEMGWTAERPAEPFSAASRGRSLA